MRPLTAVCAGLAFALFLGGGGQARAFCRARTCDPSDPKQGCVVDKPSNCVKTGQPLHWVSSCVTFGVQEDGSRRLGIDANAVMSATDAAFSAWLSADCGGIGPSLTAASEGPVACAKSQYNKVGKNANIVMFRDDAWPYPGSSDSYALTIVRFDAETGEIFDADIEVNSADYEITTDGSGLGSDLQSILTHEAGHFLGLAHTAASDDAATMRTFWNGTGLDLRTLSLDDMAGICSSYPPGRIGPTSCTPRHGFASECDVPVEEADEGCGLARPSAAGGKAPALILGALVVGLLRLKRRTRESPQSRA